MKFVSIIVLISMAVAIYTAPSLNSGWLLASKSYDNLDMPSYGGVARLFVYATSAIMGMSILAWIPQKQYFFTRLGTRTLYVYLLHGFMIQFFRQKELFEVNHLFDVVWIAVVSAGIVLLLSTKPVLGVWQPAIEGKMTILRKAFHRDYKKLEHKTE